jgi:uncharacterized protein YkwD
MIRKVQAAGLVIATAVVMALAGPGLAANCERPADAAIWEKALLNWVNAERKALGLSTFRSNGKLQKAALAHACDMVEHNYFEHSRPGGPNLKERIKAVGYRFKAASENLAYTRQPDPGTVAEIWRNSSVHWGSMISPSYNEAGISIATGNGKIYWVMDMGRQK